MGMWFHVAIVVTATDTHNTADGPVHEFRLYKDGRLLEQGVNTELSSGAFNVTVGGMAHGNPLCGSLAELRVWKEPLSEGDINSRRGVSIPVIDASYPTLRLSWLPLRHGGPKSYATWWRTINQRFPGLTPGKVPLDADGVPLYTVPVHLLSPKPTLLWDLQRGCDTGVFMGGTVLSASRFRGVNGIFSLPLTLPPTWSPYLLFVIDEWTDEYDKAFVPETLWPVTNRPTPGVPSSTGPGELWIPRVMKFPYPEYSSTLLGSTSSLGLENAGGGAVGFTLELWIRYVKKAAPVGWTITSPMALQNILGNEDADSNVRSGFLGTGKAYALRIGLVNGRPYVSVTGDINGLSSAVAVAPLSLLPLRWAHIAVRIISSTRVWMGSGDAFECCYAWDLIKDARLSLSQRVVEPPASGPPAQNAGSSGLPPQQVSNYDQPPTACVPYRVCSDGVGTFKNELRGVVSFRADFETRLEYDEWDVDRTADYSGGLRDGSMIVRPTVGEKFTDMDAYYKHHFGNYDSRKNVYGYSDAGDGDIVGVVEGDWGGMAWVGWGGDEVDRFLG
eukprot:gene275-286_t